MLEGRRVTTISGLGRLGIKGVHEELLEVTRFRRSLQPEGKRKRLLLQFFAHDASMRLHKADIEAGGRMRTVAADDVAEISKPIKGYGEIDVTEIR